MNTRRFPYARNDLPILPITLVNGLESMTCDALVDSGSTINVLPYDLGLQLGLDWEVQSLEMDTVGYLRGAPLFAVSLMGQISDFPPVKLCFGWSGKASGEIRLILGQRNFFRHFRILFEGYVNAFEISPRQQAL